MFIYHKAPCARPLGAVGMTDRGTQPLPTRPDPALCARFVRRGREGNSYPFLVSRADGHFPQKKHRFPLEPLIMLYAACLWDYFIFIFQWRLPWRRKERMA